VVSGQRALVVPQVLFTNPLASPTAASISAHFHSTQMHRRHGHGVTRSHLCTDNPLVINLTLTAAAAACRSLGTPSGSQSPADPSPRSDLPPPLSRANTSMQSKMQTSCKDVSGSSPVINLLASPQVQIALQPCPAALPSFCHATPSATILPCSALPCLCLTITTQYVANQQKLLLHIFRMR